MFYANWTHFQHSGNITLVPTCRQWYFDQRAATQECHAADTGHDTPPRHSIQTHGPHILSLCYPFMWNITPEYTFQCLRSDPTRQSFLDFRHTPYRASLEPGSCGVQMHYAIWPSLLSGPQLLLSGALNSLLRWCFNQKNHMQSEVHLFFGCKFHRECVEIEPGPDESVQSLPRDLRLCFCAILNIQTTQRKLQIYKTRLLYMTTTSGWLSG